MTADISRYSSRPAQKFSGLVHQQGRLPLDSDLTEAGDIVTEMLRDTVAEVICAKGAPGDAFKVDDISVTGTGLLVDFTLAPGPYYLAGVRLQTGHAPVPPATAPAPVGYRAQTDWLTFPLDGTGATAPAGDRTDLVWLLAWEQVVTAAEDSELLEPALGGPDTAARRRMMHRVQVLADVPAHCADALDDMVARELAGGTLDANRCEVRSDATLTVGFEQMVPLEDLCRPSAQAGFLGARNETFRIQITRPDRFAFGRDNAAPLYRVQVSAHSDGTRRKVSFLTPPRDQHAWPLAGMTVEILRWGALLDNAEKAAEPTGLMLKVENGYDPADDSIVVSAEVPRAWEDWFATPEGQAAINPRDEPGQETYFYLRVWTGGGEGAEPDHPMSTGNPVPLGETGLTATFGGSGNPGDFWIFSARPNTPTGVIPWTLLDGAPPTGPRRLVAPLALLGWQAGIADKPVDCRNRFRPLCRVGGCCLVTVGDGRSSFGDVTSIQDALAALPEEGGEICIQPGDYEEHVQIEARRDVTITGCGRHTLWRGRAGETAPLLSIVNGSGIVVRNLAMEGTESECIVTAQDAALATKSGLEMEDLLLEGLWLTASDHGAVAGLGGVGYRLRHCRVTLDQLSAGLNDNAEIGRAAAVFLDGDDLTVEHCQIEASDISDGLRLPVGGIHIGGGSEGVILRDNLIRGGNGHGITLGTVQFVDPASTGGPSTQPGTSPYGTLVPTGTTTGFTYYGFPFSVDLSGCIHLTGTPPTGGLPAGSPLVPRSGGLIQRVRIERNRIADMGFSGISAHVFAELGTGAGGLGDAVAVETVEIFENSIQGCMRNRVGTMAPLLRQFVGWGGVALSICSDGTIRDNIISGNGTDPTDPVCGIFLAVAEDVKIERNRIERNGGRPIAGEAPVPGRRGGVVIGIALGGLSTYGAAGDPIRDVDRPALVVAGNTVEAPTARALKAILLGPAMVLENRFTGEGRSALFTNIFGSLVAAGLSLSVLRGQILNPKAHIDLLDYVLLELLSDVLGGDAVNLVNLCVAEDLVQPAGATTTFVPQRLRGGETMVNDNQISLRPHSPQQAVNVSAVMLLSADDISYCNNQVEVENDVDLVLTGSLVLGASLRTAYNRLQERLASTIFSAVTWGVMNDSSHNQTTHCMLVIGVPQVRVTSDNRSVLGLLGSQICQTVDGLALNLSETLARTKGSGP